MEKLIPFLVKKFKTNNPFDIADGLNINVKYADLPEGTRGIYYRNLRRRFIVLNNRLDEQWQRFVCAHELAHDRLHPGISRFWLDEQSFSNAGKYERQANKFALHLLIAGDQVNEHETLIELLTRNNIPIEMERFFY